MLISIISILSALAIIFGEFYYWYHYAYEWYTIPVMTSGVGFWFLLFGQLGLLKENKLVNEQIEKMRAAKSDES